MTAPIAPAGPTPDRTLAPPVAARTASVPVTSHPAWARGGGGAIAVGGALLLAATVVEVPLWDDVAGPMLPLFTALFLASAVVHALAMLPLALGSTGADGVVGTPNRVTRMVGTVALLGFGAIFLLNQTLYYVTTYGAPDGAGYSTIAWFPPLLAGAQLVFLLAASIAVVRAGVATGAARWSLLALTIVAAIAGAVAGASGEVTVVTIALVSSCVAQIVVGAVLFGARGRTVGGTV
ncbi:hypothetical protein [Microbacterium sp. cx-59]|uniref:hypothetical protein n=1 Tax=Microbacterium sp. cx-59 TaxID=2891207 RepID=UPI001E51E4E5|nr:hypothetical protein [Microbacterium sp. cx-59]MCC4908085.1 hypothetical protein [Microbacterium sp. cx-59]